MERTTVGIFIFFLTGIFTYLIVRFSKPWPDKYQNFFWLICLSPLILTMFILPGHVDPNILNGIHAMLAGIMACEYIRTKHRDKINKVKGFRESVEQERAKIKSQERKKTRNKTDTNK